MITLPFFIGGEMVPPIALTGLPSVDLVILEHLNDESLKALALCNQYVSELCRDLWKNRLLQWYGPTILDRKPDTLGYREYYFFLDTSSIAVGASHTVVLDPQGKAHAFGNNEYGQLGLGHNAGKNVPTLVPFPDRIQRVACGIGHTIFLDAEGHVYACGDNRCGHLGLGHYENRNIPTRVTFPFSNRIQRVACGDQHTMFLDVEGQVYACGNNRNGQLGLGHNEYRNVPTLVPFLNRIRDVVCGSFHTMLLDVEGKVYVFGNNQFGQLGLGYNEDRNVRTVVPFPNRIQRMACGEWYTMLLDVEGHVYACGYNEYGQLGLRDNVHRNIPTLVPFPFPNRIRDVACGDYHTMFLDVEGHVYACGDNEYGQLGLGHNVKRNVPTVILFPFPKPIQRMGGGYSYSIFLDVEGQAYACGYNDFGQLGLGHNGKRNIPTIIPGLVTKV